MNDYNSAFFGLFENLYLELLEELGEEKALFLFRKIMEKGLRVAYDKMGFTKGSPEDFSKILKERDNAVGILVEFPIVSSDLVVYRFHTDPFPHLKGMVSNTKLDDTYIAFKIKHILGDDWQYETTKHIWKQDPYTEFVISKIAF